MGDSLETLLLKEFYEFNVQVAQMIERENDTLRSLGINPPRIVSEFSYSTTFHNRITKDNRDYLDVKIIPPKFDYPPHHVFLLQYDVLACTIFEYIDHAKKMYEWWGLADAVKSCYSPIWTNRSPFAFYKELESKQTHSFLYSEYGALKKNVEREIYTAFPIICAKKIPTLKKVPSLSYNEVANIHSRVTFYNYVDPGYKHIDEPLSFYPAWYMPKDLFFDLPVPLTTRSKQYSCIKILPSNEIKPSLMVEFLNNLRGVVDKFISFELMREDETVCFRMHFPSELKTQILTKINLYFPNFEYLEVEGKRHVEGYYHQWLQKKAFYNPIQRLRDFKIDPYANFVDPFSKEAADNKLSYLIIFAPLSDKAAVMVKKSFRSQLNKSHRADHLAEELPAWFASVQVSGTNEELLDEITEDISATLGSPNESFLDPNQYLFEQPRVIPYLYPAFFSLYNTDELAALVHFPISPLLVERLEKTSMKNVKPPESYINETTAVRVGQTKARGQIFPVTIPENVRDRHVYIVGKSGTGKSTIMETIALRDIAAGRGIAVIDPHGDLIQHLLENIPEHRVDDCILFSPKHFPVSLEILSAENDQEIDLLSDDLITMFRRTSESWGDKMQAILQMAFQTLLRVPGSSFTDITRLLTDEGFRNNLLTKINHPQLESFWTHRYEMKQAEPILIRMDRLTTSGTLREVLTQNKNSLNFYDVITESKIFLADLSKGFLGESTSHLLGSIIVSQIQLAAMRQAHLPIEQRIPFSLFVDEVQNFTTNAFGTILSEARKQKLRLTIAHQFVSQLPTDLQKAVFGNVGTLFFFALSPDDLGAARHELGTFEPQDVANLPKYHALCRPATAARDTFLFATDPPPAPPETNYTQQIIEQTRRKYAPKQPYTEINIESKEKTTHTSASDFIQPNQIEITPQIQLRPGDAAPLFFSTNTEKILHYLRQAEYLTQPQIIALTDLLPPNASTALKKLCEFGQVKSLDDRRPKIYFIGRNCNATTHNILVRDLFVKICASKFAIRSVKFNENLSDLNPDLSVEFVAKEKNTLTPLPAYFELDRGTEGVQELVKKADRYARLSNNPRVGFIFERESDLLLARKTIQYPFIYYAVLNDFTSLRDEAFYAGSAASPASDTKLPYFGS